MGFGVDRMTNATVARVTGMHDAFSSQVRSYKQVESALTDHFELYGYAPLALPVVEYSELYLRKSGEDIVSRMYDFHHRGRRLCLRPEMTASTMRAFIEHMQDQPLPVRLYYSGPVFRYERPELTSYRQFTQVGLELIGVEGVLADAEVIHTACSALDSIGIKEYKLVIGHVGILNSFLNSLNIDGQLHSFLLLNMEALRKQGKAHVAERLGELYPPYHHYSDLSSDNHTSTNNGDSNLISVLRNMQPGEAREFVIELLESLNLGLDNSRNRDEVIDRLLAKLRRGDQTAVLNTALQFMTILSQLRGEPHTVIAECVNVLERYRVETPIIQHLTDLCLALDTFGVNSDRLSFDLGKNLGFQYYTGLIFEIHHDSPSIGHHLCGGGRYDDLISLLGSSQPQPATGFSFGLEWVFQALEAEGLSYDSSSHTTQVLVAGAGSSSAVKVAERVRQLGWRTALDLLQRDIHNSLDYAARMQIPWVVIVNQYDSKTVLLKDMFTQAEFALELEQLPGKLEELGTRYV